MSHTPFVIHLAAFAADLTGKFAAPLHFNPEDQLKAPLLALVRGAADLLGLTVESLTEVQDRERAGRPDVGVVAQHLLAGYVELKAPGKRGPNQVQGRGSGAVGEIPRFANWIRLKALELATAKRWTRAAARLAGYNRSCDAMLLYPIPTR